MRFTLPLTFLLASLAPAAPVPVDKAAERKAFEAHWDALWSRDAAERARALFAFLDHPRAADFLAEKVPPIDSTKEQLTGWLKDLNSDDETVRDKAMDRLWYHDPRVGLTAREQLDLVTTDAARWRLGCLWWGGTFTLWPQTTRVTIEPKRGGNGQEFVLTQRLPDSVSTTDIRCPPVREIVTSTWLRATTGAYLLHRLDTKASRAALERLAAGHPDAVPTRAAAALLKANPPPLAFDRAWAGLLVEAYTDTSRHTLAVLDTPDVAKKVRPDLPTITASKAEVTGWVKALNEEGEKDWKPAFEKLQLFHPHLALTWQEQCDLATTDRGRFRLFRLAGWASRPLRADGVYADCMLEPQEKGGLTFTYAGRDGRVTVTSDPHSLETLNPPHWQRARVAVIVLERMKTDEAKAVLKQLADGHPDILPTKEAKAALEGLK